MSPNLDSALSDCINITLTPMRSLKKEFSF